MCGNLKKIIRTPCTKVSFHYFIYLFIYLRPKNSNMPASETSRKSSTLKVSINICSNYWNVYTFCIVNVDTRGKIFFKTN
jgi:hypothetical protein